MHDAKRQSALLRYGVPLAASLTAAGATWLLPELLAPVRLLFFWVAVIGSALLGVRSAIVATLASAVLADLIVFPPIGAPSLGSSRDVIRFLLFIVLAGSIGIAVGLMRAAQMRAEELRGQLQISELTYRSLVEVSTVPQAVWTATRDGKITWTPALQHIIGRTADGLSMVAPEDAERTLKVWHEALRSETPYEDEVRVRVASGHLRWFAIRAVPIVVDGEVTRWVGTIADIHERKLHARDANFINRAAAVLGASLHSDSTLRDLARLCVPELADWCAIDLSRDDSYERVIVEPSDAETSDAASAGPQRAISVPMFARGRMLGLLTLGMGGSGRRFSPDDRPLAEEVGRRAGLALDNSRLYDEARRANNAKDEFLATLSHELRTPLTTILGWADLMQGGGMDEETSRLAVETIVRSAKSQEHLIEELLDLSRIVAGKLEMVIAPVEMSSVIEHVITAATPAADAKQIGLSFERPPAQLFVRGDARRLSQIAWNLVGNAVKFTPANGHVNVRLTKGRGTVKLQVEDDGGGVDPQFLPHIWERFRQADSSASRPHGGLGLGLAVVRYLVEAHGGTVSAQSAGVGKGAVFTVELPAAAETEIQPAPAAGLTGTPRMLDGTRVLIVDDDEDSREVIAAMLRQYGALVTASSCADDALAQIAAGTFDLVVTDIAMPGRDGFSLLRDVREKKSGLRVIALSGMGGMHMRARATAAGFDEFVLKPVEPRKLAEAVAKFVGSS